MTDAVVDGVLAELGVRPRHVLPLKVGDAGNSNWRVDLDDGQVVGWPLSDLEVAALEPMQRAFRVDMAAWSMEAGLRSGSFDLDMIRRQLERTGTAAP